MPVVHGPFTKFQAKAGTSGCGSLRRHTQNSETSMLIANCKLLGGNNVLVFNKETYFGLGTLLISNFKVHLYAFSNLEESE